MRTYKEIQNSIPKPEIDDADIVYFAYKGGKSKKFDNIVDAQKFSPITERVIVNDDIIREQKKAVREWTSNVHKMFVEELKEEHSMLVKLGVFDISFAYVCDNCSSEVDNRTISLGELENVIAMAVENALYAAGKK